MPFTGIMLFEEEPERECWHEAGHAIVGHHLGLTVLAIGYSWVSGENADPNPSTWMATYDGFDNHALATHALGGMAAEITKLGDYDMGASNSDGQHFQELGCSFSRDHYTNEAVRILAERDAALVRVYDRLMKERMNPSYPPFEDTIDHMKKQVHLTREEFEALM